MTRTQRYLGGLLLLQVVLILLFRSPLSGSTGTYESHPLLPQLADLDASRIEFLGQDGKALNVRHEGDAWSVVEADGFPADAAKIRDLVEELSEIKVRQPVVSSDRYHKTFKVAEDDNEGRLRVWSTASDKPAIDLILGTAPNYQLTHVRVKGDDRVYEVRGLAPYDVRADAADWVQKALVDVPADQVVGLRLTNPAGGIDLARRDGQWTLVEPSDLAGSPLDPAKVDDLVRIARTLRIDSPAGALDEQAQGLSEPAATITLRYAPADAEGGAPREVVVRVGSRLPDKETQRFVTRSGLPFAATVWESSVKGLIEKTAAELLSPGDTSPADS